MFKNVFHWKILDSLISIKKLSIYNLWKGKCGLLNWGKIKLKNLESKIKILLLNKKFLIKWKKYKKKLNLDNYKIIFIEMDWKALLHSKMDMKLFNKLEMVEKEFKKEKFR